jgi:putative tryptophan/tyrosine transport system substrate-binding protein
MRRRHVFAFFCSAAALWSLAGIAEQRKVPTIGVLMVESPGSDQFRRLLPDLMRNLGYVEGQSIRYEFRSGQVSRLPDLAAELVRLNVDVIVTWFTPAAQAAKRATSQIPIVMALGADPIEIGLVQSLDRPGGNVTGIAAPAAELAGKCVELIRDVLPQTHHVVALANAADTFSKPFVEGIRLAGVATKTMIDVKMIRGVEELDAAFREMEQERPDGVIVQPSLPSKRAVELALRYRIPTASVVRGFVEEGGLMSYLVGEPDIYRRAAAFVDRILKGTKPADLPVEEPTKFELIINMKTAEALGISIPQSVLLRADELVE